MGRERLTARLPLLIQQHRRRTHGNVFVVIVVLFSIFVDEKTTKIVVFSDLFGDADAGISFGAEVTIGIQPCLSTTGAATIDVDAFGLQSIFRSVAIDVYRYQR